MNEAKNPAKKGEGAARSKAGVAKTLLIVQLAFWIVFFAVVSAVSVKDKGIRLFLLNHTPDELIVVNAASGEIEKRMAVADGLQKLVFSTDGKYAYISNAVDVTNKITAIDAHRFLKTEIIEVDGIPQDLAIASDNRRLVVVSGARTDFMASGFDVLDLHEQSPSGKGRKARLYRARDLKLAGRIEIDRQTELLYAIDSKDSKVFVYDINVGALVNSIEINGAPIDMCFPKEGRHFFVSTIRRGMIFVIDRFTNEIVKTIRVGRSRQMAASRDGSVLYVPLAEARQIAVVDVAAGRVAKTIPIPHPAEIIEISPFDDTLYVVDSTGSGWLTAIDIESEEVIYDIEIGGVFRDIGIRPLGGH